MAGPLWNEGRSVHVGLDRVGPVYRGWLNDLRGAENDAREMRRIADSMGFASRLIVGESATREAVRDGLEATIERLVDGDVLLVTFAGHMTSLAGAGDDPDGWDEAWCLHDGVLLDDEFHDLLAAVPDGADVLVVTDSCFAEGIVDGGGRGSSAPQFARGSGTALAASGELSGVASPLHAKSLETAGGHLIPRTPHTRIGDLEIARLVAAGALPRGRALPASQRRPIAARVVAIGAAEEGSLAYDGEQHGLFTAALLGALDHLGGPTGDYGTLLSAIAERLPFQRPTLGVFGSAGPDVVTARAFGAGSAEPARRQEGAPAETRRFGKVGK